jgi:hypothetical protein
MLAILVSDESFGCQVGFDICKRLASQLRKPFFIWFKGHAAVYKKCEVWPDVVNRFEFVPFDNIFHTHLYPSRHTNNETDIPIGSLLNDGFNLFIPVASA